MTAASCDYMSIIIEITGVEWAFFIYRAGCVVIDFEISGVVRETVSVGSSMEQIDLQKGDHIYISARVKHGDAVPEGPFPYECSFVLGPRATSGVVKRIRAVVPSGGRGFPSLGEIRYHNGGEQQFDMNPTLTAAAEWEEVTGGIQRSYSYKGAISTPDSIESISISHMRPVVQAEGLPGFKTILGVNESCTLGAEPYRVFFSKTYQIEGELPVDVSVLAPNKIDFGPVTLGSEKNIELPIQVTTNGAVSYDLFLRADKPQIGGTGLIGSGSYRIDLPADLGGGSADLSGTTGIPLVAAGEGITTINSNITLSVPDNADVGDHSANLTVTIRQK